MRFVVGLGGLLVGALLAVGFNALAGGEHVRSWVRAVETGGGFGPDLELVNSDCDGAGTDCVVAWANTGDAHFYIGTKSQGIQFNTQTNGYLALYDESGGDAIIKSSSFNVSKYGIQFYRSPTATISNGYPGGNIDYDTADSSGTSASGWLGFHTGNQSNAAGNYASGAITIYSGDTTTDGDSGDITIKTGAAGAGAADAGDILLQTHGANTRFKIFGAGDAVQLPIITGTGAPSAPVTCNATNAGAVAYTDDTDDSAAAEICVCAATGDDGAGTPTMDWRQLDNLGTACSFY